MAWTSSLLGVAAGLLAVGAVNAVGAVAAAPPPSGSAAALASRPARAGVTSGSAGPAAAVMRFGWPLAPVPRVLRGFAVGPHPWSPGHRGVDLAALPGQAVLAAGPGLVTFAGRVAGRGVVVVAHAGGLRTTYEPVAAGVGVGRATVAGTPLGALEAGHGHCVSSCLHWGALRGDVYVDPLTLLGPPPLPVLLPDAEGVS